MTTSDWSSWSRDLRTWKGRITLLLLSISISLSFSRISWCNSFTQNPFLIYRCSTCMRVRDLIFFRWSWQLQRVLFEFTFCASQYNFTILMLEAKRMHVTVRWTRKMIPYELLCNFLSSSPPPSGVSLFSLPGSCQMMSHMDPAVISFTGLRDANRGNWQ